MRTPTGFRSLRWRLTALIGGVLVLAVAGTFVAIYNGTGSEVRGQIDHELRGDALAFRRAVPATAQTATAVEAAARAYLGGQPFRPSSRLLFLRVAGRAPVTNEPELLRIRHEHPERGEHRAEERRQAIALLGARPGLSNVHVEDVGAVRLLTVRIVRGATRATIGVGEPLEPAERAQHGVARTFVLAGSVTLVIALLAGYLIAVRTTRPLSRMARIAQQVDAGDLSPRMSASGPHDEIRVLADSFDHMLDRLGDAFARQRAFASDASHELRTPLTVVRGQLEVLARLESPTAEEVRRVEALVRTETLRMQRLVEDLLALARSEERAFLNPRPFALDGFVAELLDGVTATADRRFERSGLPPGTLHADPDRLAQALRNLLRNAIEHTSPGGLVRLGVETVGTHVRFLVDDDGPGIPVELRDRIFDRFQRTDSARSRTLGGSGLGLAIVRAIVEAHGGRAWAEESPEGGARVTFELPGWRPEAPPEPHVGPVAGGLTAVPAGGADRRPPASSG